MEERHLADAAPDRAERIVMNQELLKERKKTIYDLICDELYVPMKAKEMAALLNIPKSQRHELQEVLDALIGDGKIEVSEKGKYQKSRNGIMTGVFEAHARGFGFVTVEGEEEDIFIPESKVNGAMHQDTVQISVRASSGKRREGEVLKILSHGLTSVVGTFEKCGNFGFVRPDDQKIGMDIFVPLERSKGAVDGHKVVVEFTSYGKPGKKPEGKVVEILGHKDDPGVDILSIVKEFDLPVQFSEKIARQVENVAKPVSTADMAGRTDYRDLQTVTIDGEDAKDLDDAVTLDMEGEFYRLGVHIADVANYVQERSALDAEALKRGTSVYLVDRVIPMLPHQLSNGICSLNQGEDRLTLSCMMKIDKKGTVVDYKISESVIRVDRRMSYTNVNGIVTDRDPDLMKEYAEFVDLFDRMKELADILRGRRKKRGSIDFDFPESKVILDEQGRPLEIKAYERNAATKIIEDFMLIANETVAQDFFWREIPFVYRTHENPDPEKIHRLSTFINNFGYHIHTGGEDIHPKELQKLLGKIEGTPEEALIARLTLRSMKQAKYSTECVGHFGLAAQYYCHFTSPIRRYPDLQIHRIIKETLRGRMNQKRVEHYGSILPEVAKQCSSLERRADEAERETVKLKKVQYMSERIGRVYEGVISGVTAYGFYVELANTIEGMVHVTTLEDDYFEFREESYEMVGETTGISYKLGQRVKVRVTGTDDLLRTIDFELVTDSTE